MQLAGIFGGAVTPPLTEWEWTQASKMFFFQWQMLAGLCPLPAALGEPDSGKSTACKMALAATGGWKNNFFASVSEKVRQNYPSLESLFKYRILSAISRDPKLLTLKLNTIVFKHKHKTFSYKPRPSS